MTIEQVLTKSETAKLLRCSVETLDRLHRQGRGPERVYVGSQVRYRLAKVIEFLDSSSERRPA